MKALTSQTKVHVMVLATPQGLPVPEPDPDYAGTPLAAIDWGANRDLSDGVLTVGFRPAGQMVMDGDGEELETIAWSAAEKSAAVSALGLFSTFLPITIEVGTWRNADFVLAMTPELDGYGEMQTPDDGVQQSGFFNPSAFTVENGNLNPGGLGFETLIHEFGHGFGLAHPHDDGGISDVLLGVVEDGEQLAYTTGYLELNQGVFTMMSYNEGYVTSPDGPPPTFLGFEKTPMALDIAVLQGAYGVNESFAAGNNRYLLPNQNEQGAGWVSIWDSGGHDQIIHAGADAAVIDLRPAALAYELGGGGFISRVDGIYSGLTIAAGVTIEDAIGGSGDDHIIGNDESNLLRGRDGDDTILGFGEADRIAGGEGDDLINGGEGSDWIDGGSGDDLLTGDDGNDTLNGGDDDDQLIAGVGDDLLLGGTGDDELSGGAGDDRVFGHGGDDFIEGGTGDDEVRAGSGRDFVLGGFGDDRIVGGSGKDTLIGQDGADRLAGGAGYDLLRGEEGNDILFGGVGNDKLLAGAGKDVLSGGEGADMFFFNPGWGNNLIVDFMPGEDVIAALDFGFANRAAVLATASESDAGTVLELDAHTTVHLARVAMDALSVDDFLVG